MVCLSTKATQRVAHTSFLLMLSRALLQATPPATPDPPPPVAAVQQAGFGILNSPTNNPPSRGGPNAAQRPATPPSALANSLRSSPSPPRETEAQAAGSATPSSGQAVSAEELAKQTARRVKVLLCPANAWYRLSTRTAVGLRWGA